MVTSKQTALERMAFKRHFARVGAAERCTESIFTEHQRQVCDYALVYAEKKNDGEAPYSVSFTATQSGVDRRHRAAPPALAARARCPP